MVIQPMNKLQINELYSLTSKFMVQVQHVYKYNLFFFNLLKLISTSRNIILQKQRRRRYSHINKKLGNSFSADTLSVRNVKRSYLHRIRWYWRETMRRRKTVMLKFDRKQQNSGKQLSFNEKLIEKINEGKLKWRFFFLWLTGKR